MASAATRSRPSRAADTIGPHTSSLVRVRVGVRARARVRVWVRVKARVRVWVRVKDRVRAG